MRRTFLMPFLALSVTPFLATSADAQSVATTAAITPSASCASITISVNFKMEDPIYNKLKNDFDQRLFLLDGFVRQQNIKKFDIQNMSYDLYLDDGQGNTTRSNRNQYQSFQGQFNGNNNNGNGRPANTANPVYRLEGSAEYHIDSSDSAFKIGQFLTQQKFEVTVSNKTDPNKPCKPAPAAQPVPTAPEPTKDQADVKSVLENKPPANEELPVHQGNNGPPVLAIPVLDAPPPDTK